MNQEELLNKPVGTKELPKLEAKNVIVKEAIFDEVGKNNTKILKLSVKHPDKDDLIIVSKANLLIDKSIKELSFWLNEDADGNIQKGSGIARVMDFYNLESLLQLKDMELMTELDGNGYLVAKAY